MHHTRGGGGRLQLLLRHMLDSQECDAVPLPASLEEAEEAEMTTCIAPTAAARRRRRQRAAACATHPLRLPRSSCFILAALRRGRLVGLDRSPCSKTSTSRIVEVSTAATLTLQRPAVMAPVCLETLARLRLPRITIIISSSSSCSSRIRRTTSTVRRQRRAPTSLAASSTVQQVLRGPRHFCRPRWWHQHH